MDAEKERALKAALTQIEKDYGKGTVMRMGDRPEINVPIMPTGILELDAALVAGGLPRGRIIEIYGPESSGKTTIALQIVAEEQKRGGACVYIDAEHALDPVYARNLGVDIDNLYISQPDNGEQALEIADALARTSAVNLIVIDSVPALTPRSEIDGDMGDTFVGLQARLMSQAMRKMAGVLDKSQTTVIFINQLREKIGIMFGNPETTPGGRALKFYASVRLDVRKADPIKLGDKQIGNKVKIKVAKNKIAAPFNTALCEMIYGEGISKISSLISIAVERDIIQKSGSWFSYNGERIGQGRDNVKKFLTENTAIAEDVERKVREEMAALRVAGSAPKKPAVEPPAEPEKTE